MASHWSVREGEKLADRMTPLLPAGMAAFASLAATWRRSLGCKTVLAGIVILSLYYSLHIVFHIDAVERVEVASKVADAVHNTFDESIASPFSGAFARFPRVSSLAAEQRRLTVVGVWNDDGYEPYLRHFFHTVQLNADTMDLVMINRKFTPGKGCLDLEKLGVNITWGGNIHMHCIDDAEWKARHAKFVCSREYGWNCNKTQYQEVLSEFGKRHDSRNYNWRPFRGYMFRDLFPNPQNPLWAWIDHDTFVGDFNKYPFNILSQVSILTGSQMMPFQAMLAGQLTAWNMADPALGSAWKKFPEMRTPDHFTKYTAGRMLESPEEVYWSAAYLTSTNDLPGSELSWAMYPDMHGDDYFDNGWKRKRASQTSIVSGREILVVSTTLAREEMEHLILQERNTPPDDLGNIGWTGGEDGSQWVVDQPGLPSGEARLLANRANPHLPLHQGLVDDQVMGHNCSSKSRAKHCVSLHPMARSTPPLYRQSLVHFKEQEPDRILRRLERDDRPRGYERKLIRHFLFSKNLKWFGFPPFEITDDLVFQVNFESAEVWRMGNKRNETLFLRKEGTPNIG